MGKWEELVARDAWDRLVRRLVEARDEEDREDELSDYEIAEIVRDEVFQVEGEEI